MKQTVLFVLLALTCVPAHGDGFDRRMKRQEEQQKIDAAVDKFARAKVPTHVARPNQGLTDPSWRFTWTKNNIAELHQFDIHPSEVFSSPNWHKNKDVIRLWGKKPIKRPLVWFHYRRKCPISVVLLP